MSIGEGCIPGMIKGDILGHEFMGEVVEVGPRVSHIAIGDRVVVPFPIACGECFYCKLGLWSLCDNSNPNAALLEDADGYAGAGLYGHSQLYGGFAGGQAEYVRVPYADVGPLKVPDQLKDEQVLFLSDILPTGYQAAEHCNIHAGDVVAVWGCGPVGLFALKSARLLGAERVIAIDRVTERLAMARSFADAETIDEREHPDVVEELKLRTAGRGPDSCIDAVGMEGHSPGSERTHEKALQATRVASDRAGALRQILLACRKGGTVSIVGVYSGIVDRLPFGAAFSKNLTLKMGQCHAHRYMKPLLARIQRGEIDPAAIITHRLPLERAPEGYRTFRDKKDGCVKVVLYPDGSRLAA